MTLRIWKTICISKERQTIAIHEKINVREKKIIQKEYFVSIFLYKNLSFYHFFFMFPFLLVCFIIGTTFLPSVYPLKSYFQKFLEQHFYSTS